MGLLQTILGGKNKDKIIDTALGAVKGIGKFIDEQRFTTEEAAIFNKGTAEASAQFVKDTLSENTARSKTRRSIAVDYVRFFCIMVVCIIIIKITEQYVPGLTGAAEYAKGVIVDFNLHYAFLTIIAFFFGGHYLRQYQGQAKKK